MSNLEKIYKLLYTFFFYKIVYNMMEKLSDTIVNQ